MKKRKVAVVAGTPVDTKMGVQYIESQNDKNIETVYHPISESCDAQLAFQYESEKIKREIINDVFDAEIADGVRDFFIYCNSLSGAFDFDAYAVQKTNEMKEQGIGSRLAGDGNITDPMAASSDEIRIYTPLQIYRNLGSEYSCVGVMAAHNLSAHAVEDALMSTNPGIYVIGTGNMSIVRAIEEGKTPTEIVHGCGLASMLEYMEASGAQAVVLGCTHFPYLKDELSGLTKLPLIDPADLMYQKLLQNI